MAKDSLFHNAPTRTASDKEIEALSLLDYLEKLRIIKSRANRFILRILKRIKNKILHIMPFKKEIYSVIKHFYIPSSYYTLPIKGHIKLFWDKNRYFKIYIDNNLYIEKRLFWFGFYGGFERKSLKLWIKLCRYSNIIFDIGANSGIYSLSAQSVNPNSMVYAFEPVEKNLELLIYNNKLNNFNIKIINKAISNKDGQASMFILPDVVNYMACVNKNIYFDKEVIETLVPTIKLSTFITTNDIKKIDLIKIDVEGHELEVLQGLEPYIKKMRPTFLIEIIGDSAARKIQNLFHNLNYLYFLIDEINEPQLTDIISDKDHHNYLICTTYIAKQLELI